MAEPLSRLLRRSRQDRGLTQEELAERAGLSVRAVQDLERGLSAPRPDTWERLVTALALEGEPRRDFEAAARRCRRERLASPPRKRVLATNLPRQLTSFVGHEQELIDLPRRLGTTAPLTLTGAGGVGKTRLALRVAETVVLDHPDGVWLVELAPLRDAGLIPQLIADVVGAREQPGRALRDTLVATLRHRRLLLVLDNCEHLVEACAELVEHLLRACPGLRVLATSREPLRVAGEVLWRVPSLSVPTRLDDQSADALARSEAGRLFVERARASAPGFALTDRTARLVADVCWRLDGIPLAIELAAARVHLLSVDQLAARLDDRFRLLVGGSRTAPPRQQTLRATVAWSYELLDARARRLFEHLAVFAGGWTLEAAEAVCGDDHLEAGDVLDLLGQLVDRSLVQAEATDGGAVRYRLHETLREYGWACLATSGAADTARRRHRAFYLALAERAEPELTGAEPAVWLRRLDLEHDNVRAALRWTIASGEAQLGLRLGAAVWRFWFVRGHEQEGRRWLEELVALAERGGGTVPATRAAVLSGAAALARDQGDYDQAAALSQASLALYREQGDPQGSAWALHHLGCTARDRGEYVRAATLLGESLALFRACADRRGTAWALHNLARVARDQGDADRAAALADESLALFRARGDTRGIAFVLYHLGCIARDQGDLHRAVALSRESQALCRDLGDNGGSAWALTSLGRIAADQGDDRRATALLRESLELARERGDRRELVAGVEGLAAVASAQQPERAARLFGAAQALREALCVPRPPADRAWYDQRVAAAQARLGERAFAVAWVAGRAMALEQVVADALEVVPAHS